MTSVEIHVPISLTEHFSTMCHLLAMSLSKNAALPPHYKIVFTVSRDTNQEFSSEIFAWTKHYPIEFRWVDEAFFNAWGYGGTALQRHFWDFDADIILFIDADTLALGSLNDIIQMVEAKDGVYGRTAWSPPRVDIEKIIALRGLIAAEYSMLYSGYGIDFVSPRYCPPYFNFGIIATSKSVAEFMRDNFLDDIEYTYKISGDFFNPQIALCINIIRTGLASFNLIDKFNLGNGEIPAFIFKNDPDARTNYDKFVSCLEDPRFLHYCVASADFKKSVDVASWGQVNNFCLKEGLGTGNALLKSAIKELIQYPSGEHRGIGIRPLMA